MILLRNPTYGRFRDLREKRFFIISHSQISRNWGLAPESDIYEEESEERRQLNMASKAKTSWMGGFSP
jgi:hypothetical protein